MKLKTILIVIRVGSVENETEKSLASIFETHTFAKNPTHKH